MNINGRDVIMLPDYCLLWSTVAQVWRVVCQWVLPPTRTITDQQTIRASWALGLILSWGSAFWHTHKKTHKIQRGNHVPSMIKFGIYHRSLGPVENNLKDNTQTCCDCHTRAIYRSLLLAVGLWPGFQISSSDFYSVQVTPIGFYQGPFTFQFVPEMVIHSW